MGMPKICNQCNFKAAVIGIFPIPNMDSKQANLCSSCAVSRLATPKPLKVNASLFTCEHCTKLISITKRHKATFASSRSGGHYAEICTECYDSIEKFWSGGQILDPGPLPESYYEKVPAPWNRPPFSNKVPGPEPGGYPSPEDTYLNITAKPPSSRINQMRKWLLTTSEQTATFRRYFAKDLESKPPGLLALQIESLQRVLGEDFFLKKMLKVFPTNPTPEVFPTNPTPEDMIKIARNSATPMGNNPKVIDRNIAQAARAFLHRFGERVKSSNIRRVRLDEERRKLL